MTTTGSTRQDQDPHARTTAGMVVGTWESGLAVFRGLPFAQAPVGPLRFAGPQPTTAWDGVRPVRNFGPPPPQSGLLGATSDDADQEWLTLNVWSPDPGPDAGLPVLVWIPGGGYVSGNAALPEYDGSHLAGLGTVVVTVNYRLGLEGFAELAGAPSNRGLLDQVAALTWVRDNIAAFGGDPARVTVAGQSAGGGSVAALLAMPRAADLFIRAVAQSVPGTFFTPELAADITAACAAHLGIPATRAGFATVPPAALPAAGDAISADIGGRRARWGAITHRPIPFAPVVDGDVLPSTPWDALAGGAARHLPLLTGHTRDEHRLFDLIDAVLGSVTPEQTETALVLLAPAPDGPDQYRRAFPDAGAEELYDLVNADWLFRMPSLRLAQAQAAAGGRAHLYELSWPAPGFGGVLGACHGLDLPLMFGNLHDGQPAALLGSPPEPDAVELSDRMCRAWTNFVHDGDPGWPPYDEHQRLTQVFDAASTVTRYPEQASDDLWRLHRFAALPLRST